VKLKGSIRAYALPSDPSIPLPDEGQLKLFPMVEEENYIFSRYSVASRSFLTSRWEDNISQIEERDRDIRAYGEGPLWKDGIERAKEYLENARLSLGVKMPPSISTPTSDFAEGRTDASASCIFFYQASDGSKCFIHHLNTKGLLGFFGNYSAFPRRLQGKVLEVDEISLNEEVRKRNFHLRHFCLQTPVTIAELDLSHLVPSEYTF
jgi:hypothetical protein